MHGNELGSQRCAEHAADGHADLDRADRQRAKSSRRELRDQRGRRRQRSAETDAGDESPHCQCRDARCRRGEQASRRRTVPCSASACCGGPIDRRARRGRRRRSPCRRAKRRAPARAPLARRADRRRVRAPRNRPPGCRSRRGSGVDAAQSRTTSAGPRSFADSRTRSTSTVVVMRASYAAAARR